MTTMPVTPQHQLTPQLKQLRLSGVLETLDARQRQAIDGRWSYEDFLARLLDDEIERRAQKQLAQRLRRGAINETKTFETFDFAAAPSLNRQQVLALASGAYIRDKRNVLICGPTGTGKSHVAQGLAHDACRQGHDVLFVNTHKMLRHLNGGRADGTYDKRMATYLRPAVLILDDFGLKPQTAGEPPNSGGVSYTSWRRPPLRAIWRDCARPGGRARSGWSVWATRPPLGCAMVPA